MAQAYVRTMRTMAIAAAMVALVAVSASPAVATASRAAVTGGSFAPFAAGPTLGYDDVTGRALMVRAPRRTIVVVRVAGLTPGVAYASHVHDQSCDDGDAGGHYSFGRRVRGGAASDGSEIWPGPFTAASSGRAVGVAVVGARAGADARSVVVHAPTGDKIACADLR